MWQYIFLLIPAGVLERLLWKEKKVFSRSGYDGWLREMMTKHESLLAFSKPWLQWSLYPLRQGPSLWMAMSGFFSSFLWQSKILAQASCILIFVFLRGGGSGTFGLSLRCCSFLLDSTSWNHQTQAQLSILSMTKHVLRRQITRISICHVSTAAIYKRQSFIFYLRKTSTTI